MSTTETITPIRPVRRVYTGSTLPNGGLVLKVEYDMTQEQFGDWREQGIVLARVSNEYATWSYVTDDRGIVTIAGHYFSDFYKAVADLKKRSA